MPGSVVSSTEPESSAQASTADVSLLASLNDAQREAALALVGPVCILAGAGTGKTRTITHRIAYGIRAGVYDPSRVLALTFTAKAAGELRGRLRDLGASGVAARTFHAAALSQLGFFWPHTVGGPAPAIVKGKGRLIAEASERIGLRLDPAGVRDLATEIEWRKVRELSLEDYAIQLRTTRSLPNGVSDDAALALLQAYEDIKDERRQMDFEDVLLATVGMLELEPWVTQRVREQYRFFVVDEYQDVSPLQQRLLQLWLGERRELCVVGDAAQTIYSFAGASSTFLTGFPERYPDARVVRLEDNYRSSSAIIGVANEVARHVPYALTLEPAAETPRREPLPEVLQFHDDDDEARGVVHKIGEDLRSGIPIESIAVLYRTNVQAAAVERALQDAGIAYSAIGQRRFFEQPEVRQALSALRAAVMQETEGPLFQVVSDVLRDLGWTHEPPADSGALRDRWNSWDALLRLADAQPHGTKLAEFSAELQQRAKMQYEPELRAVTLSSIHAAKGLEWDSVTIIGVSEGLLPIWYASAQAELDEERRLLYVAVTRARKRLRLTHAQYGGRRDAERPASRFLAELGTRIRRGTNGAFGGPRR